MARLSNGTSTDGLEEETESLEEDTEDAPKFFNAQIAPKLLITQIEGISVINPVLLRINALGLEGSLRNMQDGITYLGSELREGDRVLNDFVIPEDRDSLGRQHLMIKYNPWTGKYLLKDLGEGSGTFVKVKFQIPVKSGDIVSIGDSHMVILLDQFS